MITSTTLPALSAHVQGLQRVAIQLACGREALRALVLTEGLARLWPECAIEGTGIKPGRFEACLRLLDPRRGYRWRGATRKRGCRGIPCGHLESRLPGPGAFLGGTELSRRQAGGDAVTGVDRLLLGVPRRQEGH